MTELLVGTKKGLFVLRGEAGAPFEIATRSFPGDVVESLRRATGISEDAGSIAGYGIDPQGQTQAWVVRLPQ
jgi:hypothetical protein